MATLEQIQDRMKRLQAQAESLMAKKAKTVLGDIRKLMDEHGLTTADIDAHPATRKHGGRPAGVASAKASRGKAITNAKAAKGKLPPKYRDPKTGATWSGHARPPAWISKVRDRTKFLIDGSGAEAGANGVSKAKAAPKKTSAAAAGTVASTGRSKGTLPAKYCDPKTGATWSGHARPPAWIANVRDRTKFLIDVAATAPSDAVAKKGIAKKAATKKISAAKNTATGTRTSVKKGAKKATVSSTKSVAGNKTAKPASKKVAKSKVIARKTAAAKKALAQSDASLATEMMAGPDSGAGQPAV
ncbi:H-NS family nucleoid-associated regulatory protein [Caballeronia glathei]|uniref:Histidine biosynthesis protein n=1 Tax=Caballeronia glathei TaxID=60547 RepID=A0A069PU44_9BURK|nr:H-NS family nucleoid-associated regulatory protein [Caballeronia glathei]KDR40821.1 histidine biosynthesis protein [Caballeronia glathei]